MVDPIERRYRLRMFGIVDVLSVPVALTIAVTYLIIRRGSIDLITFLIALAILIPLAFLPRLIWARSLNYVALDDELLRISTHQENGFGIFGLLLGLLPLRHLEEVRLSAITGITRNKGEIRVAYTKIRGDGTLSFSESVKFQPADADAFLADIESRIAVRATP